MGDALFAAEPYTARAAEPAEQVSAGRRLTIRQADAVRRGVHPLALVRPTIRIHPDADPTRTATPENDAARSLRCGTCRHREQVNAGNSRNYPKCTWRPEGDERPGPPPRYSAGAATDVRAWWPACSDWQPREEG